MKAVRIHSYGGAEVLVYEDAPRPEPEPGEVLVRVYAAGVNSLDWKICSGQMQGMMDFSLPMILGSDAAGVVEAVGVGVTALQVGQEVYGMMDRRRSGSYAEYALGLVEGVAPKPKTLNYIEAASVPAVAMTAWQALFDKGNLSAGQTVLVHGAAGGVGIFAVQLAKWKGARVIGTASTSVIDMVRELGADEVIDYKSTRFEQAVSDVDVVLDTQGGDTRERSWEVLKPGGILVSTVPPPLAIPPERGLHGEMLMMQPNAAQLMEITKLLDAGEIRTVVERVLPLEEVRQAHELNQSGHTHGKIVLQI